MNIPTSVWTLILCNTDVEERLKLKCICKKWKSMLESEMYYKTWVENNTPKYLQIPDLWTTYNTQAKEYEPIPSKYIFRMLIMKSDMDLLFKAHYKNLIICIENNYSVVHKVLYYKESRHIQYYLNRNLRKSKTYYSNHHSLGWVHTIKGDIYKGIWKSDETYGRSLVFSPNGAVYYLDFINAELSKGYRLLITKNFILIGYEKSKEVTVWKRDCIFRGTTKNPRRGTMWRRDGVWEGEFSEPDFWGTHYYDSKKEEGHFVNWQKKK